jgi:hypothetical protein
MRRCETAQAQKGPKARPCPQSTVRVRGVHTGARGFGPERPRARTRTRSRRGGAFLSVGCGTLRRPRGLCQRASARRCRQWHLQETASQPSTKAGITNGGAAAWSNGAFSLGSMVVASTRGEKRASSPLWPLAEVKRDGEVRRCGLPARRKRKQAAARRQGRRGSRGSRRSRWVRLLPWAAPVFAADSSPAGGSPPPPSLLHPFSGETVWAVRGNFPGAARVGSSPGGSAAALNRAARHGTRGQRGCPEGRGARRDGEVRGRCAAFALGVSQSS